MIVRQPTLEPPLKSQEIKMKRIGMHLYHTPELRQQMTCTECGVNSLGNEPHSFEAGAYAGSAMKEPSDNECLSKCGKCGKLFTKRKED